MKKIMVMLITFILPTINVFASSIELSAKSGILIEESTGKVVYEKDADAKLNPASMTKIMSLILVFEAIENNKLSLTDDVVVSKEASSMGGSQVYINEGEIYKVEELIKAVAIASANDAVVALAEKVAGTQEDFVKMMNEKAKKLKLQNTNFKNPHGLDEENHFSTARDMSIMARELLKHQDILKYTSRYEDYFHKNDGSSIWLVNTNKLVKLYEGMDGLKTGYTSSAGYCLTATAVKSGIRFISVVMGDESIEQRTEDTLKMMNYGFNIIRKDVLLKKESPLTSIKVKLSDKPSYNVYLKNDVVKVYNKNSSKNKYSYTLKINENIKAPIKKNESIGKIVINLDDGSRIEEKLIIKENIKKISFIKLFLRNLSKNFN